MNCKKVTDYLHSSKQGFIIARDLKAGAQGSYFILRAIRRTFIPHLMVKQPFVVDIDIDVLFQEMAKTLDTYLTPTHSPPSIKYQNSLYIIS